MDAKERVTGPQRIQAIRNLKLLFLFLIAILAGCNDNTLYDQTRPVGPEGWHKDSLLVFSTEIQDTSQVLNLGFSMEHDNNYPYSNLWLFVDVEGPAGQLQTDTIEYFLAEPTGEWVGKGNDKSMTLHWIYKRGVKLSHPGRYSFSVQQGMRRENLVGVKSVTMWIEKANIGKP